jgi:hypothetical protein
MEDSNELYSTIKARCNDPERENTFSAISMMSLLTFHYSV